MKLHLMKSILSETESHVTIDNTYYHSVHEQHNAKSGTPTEN